MQILSMKFYSDIPAGKLMSRITNDVGAVQTLISTQIITAIGDIFTIVSSVTIMLSITWKLSFIVLAFVPLFGMVFYFFALKSRYYWNKERKTIAEITGILQEVISGSKTIKAFVTEDQNIETFNTANVANRNISLQAARLNAYLQPVTQLIVAVAIGLILYFGSMLIQSGDLDISLMLGYVIIATQFINPFNNLGNLFNQAQHSLAAGDRVLQILDTKPDITEIPNAQILPPIKGEIEYQNVEFRYVSDVPVLKDISLKTTARQRVALVGFTGAGKSTFVSLLSRFYDPTGGKILIDGYDITKVTLNSLRDQMGIVLQDTFLFSGTIMENIRYGKLNATDEEVIEAAKKVGAHPFIMNLPGEYKTEVRERGSLLSVGQRQLISFARALLANPPVLILDEATSAVDPYTELKIQEALEVLLKGRNSFVIAHRLSTILNSDLILVMENGHIIERGNHEQLVAQNGLYKHLYELQFRKPTDQKGTLDTGS
jgi:ATP-binding cassette subfamily B protein